MEVLRRVRLALQSHDYATAIRGLEEAAQAAHAAGDPAAEGRHLGNLGLIYHRLDMLDQALDCFGRALDAARADGDRLTEGGLLGNIGNVLREVKRYDEAIRSLNQALLIAQEVGDVRGRGIWLSNLALVYDDLNLPDKALPLHQQAVEVARELQDRRGLATRLGHLGQCYLALNGDHEALAAFTEAASIDRELGDQTALLGWLDMIGHLYRVLGHSAASRREKLAYCGQALDAYQQALTIAETLGDLAAVADVLQLLAGVQIEMGARDQAVILFQAARQQFAALGRGDRVLTISALLDALQGSADNKS